MIRKILSIYWGEGARGGKGRTCYTNICHIYIIYNALYIEREKSKVIIQNKASKNTGATSLKYSKTKYPARISILSKTLCKDKGKIKSF